MHVCLFCLFVCVLSRELDKEVTIVYHVETVYRMKLEVSFSKTLIHVVYSVACWQINMKGFFETCLLLIYLK